MMEAISPLAVIYALAYKGGQTKSGSFLRPRSGWSTRPLSGWCQGGLDLFLI